MRLDRNNELYVEDLNNAIDIDGIGQLYKKTVLITGATGLIGSFLIDTLIHLNKRDNAGIEIIAAGRNKEKARARLGDCFESGCLTFLEQDVRDPFPSDLNVDFIFPLASNTHPLAYSKYPIETIEINVKGAENALRLAELHDATVLYPSSVEIYGNAKDNSPFKEEDTGTLKLSSSRSCYTESKRLSESLCQSYISEKGCSVKIARLSRVFGPTMQEEDSKASSQFIKKALAKEDIVLKSQGNQFFSYTYVADAVNAMLTILLHGENGAAYNIASETCNIHLRDFAHVCAKATSRNVIYDLPTDSEKKGYSIATSAVLDNSKLKRLGWKSQYQISKAIVRTLSILGRW